MQIEMRKRQLINTDPQGRCYNGCHYKSELVWTQWEILESGIDGGPRRLKFWRELNDYAISQRGESARAEFKLVEDSED